MVALYVWKKRYRHLGAHEVRRVRQIEDENARLKRLVADLTLDKHTRGGPAAKELKGRTAAGVGVVVAHHLSDRHPPLVPGSPSFGAGDGRSSHPIASAGLAEDGSLTVRVLSVKSAQDRP